VLIVCNRFYAMPSPYAKLYKQVSSLWARIKHPERYEISVPALIWYYLTEHVLAYFRPSGVIGIPFERSMTGPELPSENVAVIVHCFYTELLGELLQHISKIPFKYSLFISTDTVDKQSFISGDLQAKGFQEYDVRIVENKGRDIAPKLITFRDVYPHHRYFLHLHSKQSAYLGPWGAKWRKYLLSNLLGSPEIISAIFSILIQPKVGLVFPEPFEFNLPQLRWENNFEKSSQLATRLNIPISRTRCPHFPVGSMFWGKTEAIQPLLDLNLKFEDFEDEKGKRDGQLEQAIERMIGLVIQVQGFYGQRISNQPDRKCFKIGSRDDLAKAIEQCSRIERE
jgi:lipopolysaccharide biosynthesis protein